MGMSAHDDWTTAPGRRRGVVMVVRLFDPWIGGMERQAHTLARGLLARGVPVEILTGWWFRGTPRREMRAGVPVTRHHTLWELWGVRGVRRLAAVMYIVTLIVALVRRRGRCGVIHVHGLNYHAAAAVAAGRLMRVPVVIKLANSGRGSDITRMRRGDQLPGSRVLLPLALRADRFVALNARVRDELLEAGVAPEQIVHIPNGVDLACHPRSFELHVPPRLVFVGRLHENKGVDTLLEAVARLRLRAPATELTLDLVGEGPQEADLRRRCASLDLEHVVRFRGRSEHVLRELLDADLLILPSRAEGMSNVLLEALSVATPCVVTDLPGNRAVVEDGEQGLVVPVDDAVALTDAIERLLADAPVRRRLGEAGRAVVEDRFATASVARSYEVLYSELGARIGAGDHADGLRRSRRAAVPTGERPRWS